MKYKVLVWNTFQLLERHGGPPTYLYNLKKSALDNGINSITFLDDYVVKKEKTKVSIFVKNKIKPLFKCFSSKKTEDKSKIKNEILSFLSQVKNKLPKGVNLKDYDFIHFHTTFDFYQNRELLSEFRGKILLTSHSPKITHKEIFEDWLLNTPLTVEEKSKVIEIDQYAFSNVDYVVFPCLEAQEPYFNSWEKYKKLVFKNEVLEFLTCTVPSIVTRTKKEIYNKYNLPKDAFIITYFGRHNQVKGYDLLKEAGEQLLNKYPNVFFLIAGKEVPLEGLKHNRWIEVGWTQDPHSLVSSSDLYILPNKETYFDLALLEVLSLGTRCLISDTGGNRYFEKLPVKETKGIHYFKTNNVKSLINEVDNIFNSNDLPNTNKLLFEKYFHNDDFAKNYMKMIKKMN